MALLISEGDRVPVLHFIAAMLVVLLGALPAPAEQAPVREYQLKAVFLFNFAKFVEWPPQSFADSKYPFNICVAGANPFGSWLDDEVRDKTVGDRPILIRLVTDPRAARNCQVLFIPASEHKRERTFLESLQGASVLTVGETDDFIANGGIVQFKRSNARIQIEIFPETAERANLRISSKLLSLATLRKGPL